MVLFSFRGLGGQVGGISQAASGVSGSSTVRRSQEKSQRARNFSPSRQRAMAIRPQPQRSIPVGSTERPAGVAALSVAMVNPTDDIVEGSQAGHRVDGEVDAAGSVAAAKGAERDGAPLTLPGERDLTRVVGHLGGRMLHR